jgi:hypothetical protein
MSKAEVLHLLEQYVARCGSAERAADEMGISETELSLVRNEKRDPTPRILARLGIEVVTQKEYKFKKR